MNLWFRLLQLIVASYFRPKLDPTAEASRLDFRVWPLDLDTSLHMNNGRYWTLMDLGRADLIIRSGLWVRVLRHRWAPIVSAARIRFRRELRLFRRFRIETRIVAWNETFIVMEHRVLTTGKKRAVHPRGGRPGPDRPLRPQNQELRSDRAPVCRDRPRCCREPGADP
jgi:acyl-CoA thioesterase FadM